MEHSDDRPYWYSWRAQFDPDKFAVDSHDKLRDRLRPAGEALGLKFETVKVTRAITIIDHVERPSEI